MLQEIADLALYRDLLLDLTRRNVIARYKRSALGGRQATSGQEASACR